MSTNKIPVSPTVCLHDTNLVYVSRLGSRTWKQIKANLLILRYYSETIRHVRCMQIILNRLIYVLQYIGITDWYGNTPTKNRKQIYLSAGQLNLLDSLVVNGKYNFSFSSYSSLQRLRKNWFVRFGHSRGTVTHIHPCLHSASWISLTILFVFFFTWCGILLLDVLSTYSL